MPSIMDLVREYSELEMKRAERGGMLEPQLEIRYQALKFFLEFELFPTPTPKPVETFKTAEKKRISEEIKKEVEPVEKIEQRSTPSSENQENNQVQVIHSPNDLASIISETTLPVSEEIKTDTIPVQSEQTDISQYQTAASIEVERTDVPLSVEPTVESSNTNTEEILEMEDVVNEAVNNIIDQTGTTPITPQSTETVESTIPTIPIQEALESQSIPTSQAQQLSNEKLIGDIDLSEHIESAFNNVIQNNEVEQPKDVVLENTLPELTDLSTSTIPSTTQDTISPQEILQEVTPQIEINNTVEVALQNNEEPQTTITIDEIMQTVLPTETPIKEISEFSTTNKEETPIINIEEIISQPIVTDTPQTDQQTPQTEPNKGTGDTNIDFLTAIDFTSQIPQENNQFTLKEEPPAISIDDIIPKDISLQQTSTELKEIIKSPSKAAVHMIDGDARRGIIKELSRSHTEIELFEDEHSNKSTKLPISSIKAIFIMKQPQEKPIDVSGVRLNVKFKDDRSIIGISPDYSDEAQVFTLIPADSSSLVKLIVVYRHFVEQVDLS